MTRSLFSVMVVMFLTSTASADPWRDGSALITCYPGTGHFELLSKQSYPDGIAPERGKIVRPISYTPSQLEEEPFTCELPGHTIVVQGRNLVDGKGYCGARAGAQVRVLINGKPVAYDFDVSGDPKPSSAGTLREGWIELSDCFERNHSLTVFSSENSISVELCRVQEGKRGPGESLIPLTGTCKLWPRSNSTFQQEK